MIKAEVNRHKAKITFGGQIDIISAESLVLLRGVYDRLKDAVGQDAADCYKDNVYDLIENVGLLGERAEPEEEHVQ